MEYSSRNSNIRIRPATVSDEAFLVSLIPRLTSFGVPVWREVEGMTSYDTEIILESLHHPSEDTAIFIAEDAEGTSHGCIHLFLGSDYYNKEKHGHISDLIIAEGVEGRGIGRMLLDTGEAWARERGFRLLTLSVFAQNVRARELYVRMGFGEDLIKYVKEL